MFVACPNHRMPGGGNKLDLQPDRRQLFHQPLRTFVYVLRIMIVRGNTGKSQKRIKIFEIVVAHARSLTKKSFPRSGVFENEIKVPEALDPLAKGVADSTCSRSPQHKILGSWAVTRPHLV